MVLRDQCDALNQSRGIIGPLENQGGLNVQNNRGRLRQRFDLIRKLGQGTYGKVQLGIDKETGQEVAIKTIKKSKIETDADLIRIRREIQIMSSVKHPNIIHIYEVFENREKMVLVMEYAAGGELYDYLNERKILQDDEARRIFRQIASAVYYCHKHKICHRDLKLENILLDEKSNAKIADFGLSNVFDDLHLLKTFCGSPLYASPEIVRGTPYAGPEVDCWSLGVLLYTLVYGAMPFDGSNFKRLVKQISHGDYYEPKKPADASPLIRLMLTVEPSKRATIKDVCNHNWVNKGADTSCLFIAEELANATPVRLDLLLSLAPSYDINHSQVVIESPSRANLAKPSTSTQNTPEGNKEKETKKKIPSEKLSAAPVKPKRKVVPVVGSKSKKSKSSPVLELILDVDVEEDAGNDEGDTLSEISEIQTIAEEPKPKKKESKPKISTKIEKPEVASKEPASKETALKEPAANSKEPVNSKEPANLKDPVGIPKESEKPEKKETKEDAKKDGKREEIGKKEETQKSSPKAEHKEDKVQKSSNQEQILKIEELPRDVEKLENSKTEKESKKKGEESEKPQLKPDKLDNSDKSEKELKDVPSTPKMVRKKSVKKVVKKKTEENGNTENALNDKSSSPSDATSTPSDKLENANNKSKEKIPDSSSVQEIDNNNKKETENKSENKRENENKKENENESNKEERGKNMIKRSDSTAAGDKSENVSPTRIERRNSKIISQKTAELIQNLETKTTSSGASEGAATPTKPVPKKLVFPLFKVSEAKNRFEKPPKPVVPINSISKLSPQSSIKFISAEKSGKVENPSVSLNSQSPSLTSAAASQSTSSVAASSTPATSTPASSKPSTKDLKTEDKKEEKNSAQNSNKIKSEENSIKPPIINDKSEPENRIPPSKPPQTKATKAPIKKLIMPDKEMKSVLVDVGGVSPKSALLLVSGKTSEEPETGPKSLENPKSPDTSANAIPERRLSDQMTQDQDLPPQPGGKKKEEAVKKICSVINKIVPSASSDGLPRKDIKPNVRTIRSEIVIPVSAPATPGERIIPIRFVQDEPPGEKGNIGELKSSESQPTMLQKKIEQNITRVPPLKILPQSPMLSRQNSSDTESSFASPPPRNEVIRKSPREFIIPIKLETTGTPVTPKESFDASESSNAEDNFRIDSRLRPGRFERQKKYSSLLTKSNLDDEPSISTVSNSSRGSMTPTGPFHVRSHSQGDEPTEMVTSPGGTMKRLRVKRGGTLERSDSVSSAEEDEEDAFEVLTAESLFSSLLDRVRNLTRRLNRDGKPETTWGIDDFWGKLPINDLMSRASSESRGMGDGGTYVSRSYSREPSVSVTISRGPSRRSLSREMSGESDSVFSDPGQLGRGSVNASYSSIGSGGCGRNLSNRNILGARSSTPRDDSSTFDTNSFRSLPTRRSLREFTPSSYIDYSSPIRPHHQHLAHHERSASDIPPKKSPFHHHLPHQHHPTSTTQNQQTSYQNPHQSHQYHTSFKSGLSDKHHQQQQQKQQQQDENKRENEFRASSMEPTSRVGMLRSISMNPRFFNYSSESPGSSVQSSYPSRFSRSSTNEPGNISSLSSSSHLGPFPSRTTSMMGTGTNPSSAFYGPNGNLGYSNSFNSSLYNNNNNNNNPNSSSPYGSNQNSSFGTLQNSSFGSQNSSGVNAPYGSFPYTKPYSSYVSNSPYGPNISLAQQHQQQQQHQQGSSAGNPFGYCSTTTTYGTSCSNPMGESEKLREFENKYGCGEARDLSTSSGNKYGDSSPQVFYNSSSGGTPVMFNENRLKSPSPFKDAQSNENEGFEKSKFNLPSLYNQPRMVRRYFSTLDEPKGNEMIGLGKLPLANNSNNPSSNMSNNANNTQTNANSNANNISNIANNMNNDNASSSSCRHPSKNDGNSVNYLSGSSTLPHISRRDMKEVNRGIEGEMENFSSPPPPDSINRVQSPEMKRDLRATSVERITRFLERNSINSPPIEQMASSPTGTTGKGVKSEGNNPVVINPFKSKPFKSSGKEEKNPSGPILPENNEIPDSGPTLAPSKSLSKLSKFSKPKFLQNLEKKWEKLTSSNEPKNSEQNSEKFQQQDSIGNSQIANPQNIRNNEQKTALTCENESELKEDFLKSSNVMPSESMLLQRAVSPEKKCKESKLPGSTVNFMLGKFRKIEETASSVTKIPNGKPPIGRRVQSVYAGTMSDSVLTLPYAPSKVLEKSDGESSGRNEMSKFGEIKKASGILKPSPLTMNPPIPESPTLVIKKFNQSPSINSPTINSPTINSPTINSPTINSPTINSPSINSSTINSALINSPGISPLSINSPTINSPLIPSTSNMMPSEELNLSSGMYKSPELIKVKSTQPDLRTPSIETQVYQVLEPIESQTMSSSFNHKNKFRDSSLPPSLVGSSSRIKSSDISNIPRFVQNNQNSSYKSSSDRLNSLDPEKRNILPEISISPELPRNNSEDLSEDPCGPVSPKSDSYDSSSVYSEKTDQSLKTSSVLDEEESVSDRIFRKSFYSRFNSLENKKKGGAASSPSFFQTSSSSSNLKKSGTSGSGSGSGGSKVKHRSSTTSHLDGGLSERRSSRSPSNLDKYNPNPLFKELISDDFPSEVGRKAEYSRRVTSKLSKLLREIDAGNTAAANNQNKSNNEKREGNSEKREKTPNPVKQIDSNV